MNRAPRLKQVDVDDKKLEMIKLKREAELFLSKIKDKLKDKKVLKKAALLIEEMMKSDEEEKARPKKNR